MPPERTVVVPGAGRAWLNVQVKLSLEGTLSFAGKLESQLQEASELVERTRALLNKPGFVEKAPKEIVDGERAKLKEREERLRLLEAELKKREG